MPRLTRRALLQLAGAGVAGAALGCKTVGTSASGGPSNVIIDSHCHAWSRWPYTPAVPDPESRGMVEQLLHQMDLHGVAQATVVSAEIDHNPANNAYVADAVKRYPGRIHQLADVDSAWTDTYHIPGAAARMERAVNKWLPAGFTHYLTAEDDGTWLSSQDGLDFFAVAADAGLIASISCFPHHQAALRRVAERFPDMPILCHHLSALKATESAPYPDLMNVLESSALPNIYLKLSGFAYASAPDRMFEYPYLETHRIIEACYEHFGTRLVWGSDFPVVNFYMTYQQSLEAFRRHCGFVSEADKTAILGGTLGTILEQGRQR